MTRTVCLIDTRQDIRIQTMRTLILTACPTSATMQMTRTSGVWMEETVTSGLGAPIGL
jgi:hypothetical protein